MSKPTLNRTQAHLAFIDDLYTAAIDGEWERILGGVAELTHGCGGNIFLYNHKQDSTPLLRSHRYANSTMRDYFQHYIHIDPKALYLNANPLTQLYYDDLYISEKEKKCHPYYAWEQGAGDKHYTIGALLHQNDEIALIFSTGLTKQQMRHKERALSTYQLIYPHLKRATQISRLLELKHNLTATLNDQLDQHPAGIFILDRKGHVLYSNPMAQTILTNDDGIALIHNQITFNALDADRMLKKQLAAITNPTESRYTNTDTGTSITIARINGEAPYQAILSPVHESEQLQLHERPAAILMIYTAANRIAPSETQLRRLHGLSPREAALARKLMAGNNLNHAADELGISLNTAKVHLRHLFTKTQTKDQTQLIRLLLASPFFAYQQTDL